MNLNLSNLSNQTKILAVIFAIILGLMLSLFFFPSTTKQQKFKKYHTLNEYISDGKATALLLKEPPELWTGFTYRYDIEVSVDEEHYMNYIIWVDNNKKIVEFGPESMYTNTN